MKKVVIIGAGPTGLACALKIKLLKKNIEVIVFEKSGEVGGQSLSGAVMQIENVGSVLDELAAGWRTDSICKGKINRDDIYFLSDKKHALKMNMFLDLARVFKKGPKSNVDNVVVSISRLSHFMSDKAIQLGVKVMTSFPVAKLNKDDDNIKIKTVAQGINASGEPQENYLASEQLSADFAVLAEGAFGKVTEDFISCNNLERIQEQLMSIGIKEIIRISDEQYQKFGRERVVHTLGYPLWKPLLGPDIFGGGLIYDYGDNNLAVGIIAGLDWQYCDFSPQEALNLFKNHSMINQYLNGGKVVECGAKIIPEGGLYSIPREKNTGTIGKENVVIAGDSAGMVNMQDIKGLHNAILSGVIAAEAIISSLENPRLTAKEYTERIKESTIWQELYAARNFRQTISKFGNTFGLPLSMISTSLPALTVKSDRTYLTDEKYPFRAKKKYDKNYFTAMADVSHREDQPPHCIIINNSICDETCESVFGSPCLQFCPGGVYDRINGVLKVTEPSNCLHCHTCENKCPFNNIQWKLPEGNSGPNYKNM